MKHFTSFFFLLLVQVCFSQIKQISSKEYNLINNKAKSFVHSNIDSAFYYANKILLQENVLYKASAYGIKSYLFQLKGDSINSKVNYNEALKHIKKVNSSSKLKD